jgi:hypothetical protein
MVCQPAYRLQWFGNPAALAQISMNLAAEKRRAGKQPAAGDKHAGFKLYSELGRVYP